jgi:hypothetical protein
MALGPLSKHERTRTVNTRANMRRLVLTLGERNLGPKIVDAPARAVVLVKTLQFALRPARVECVARDTSRKLVPIPSFVVCLAQSPLLEISTVLCPCPVLLSFAGKYLV